MNPWLKVKQAEVDQANVEIELAQKDYWPDMDFTVAYGQREEDLNGRDLPDFFSASVVINIPLWQKTRQDKKLEATKLSHQAALQVLSKSGQQSPSQNRRPGDRYPKASRRIINSLRML